MERKRFWTGTTALGLLVLRAAGATASPPSANVRFAWLNRSGTGLFVVFNERRDFFVPGSEPLGRSFIVKYTHYFEL